MSIRNELLNEICIEQNIKLEYLADDYILCLSKGDQLRYILGPYWDINSAAADRLACDKAGCCTMLKIAGISAIEHEAIYNPLRWPYLIDHKGTMSKAIAFFEANRNKIVAKPNQGSQGKDVYFCGSVLSLEQAIQTIFITEPDVALSPYYEIQTEYRVFYLNGRTHYMYGKTKGNNGKHNLSQGAKAFEVMNSDLKLKLSELAIHAAKAININFATIDIACLEKNELAVLEINSGVQAQLLLKQLPHHRQTIKSIYAEAISDMFREANNPSHTVDCEGF